MVIAIKNQKGAAKRITDTENDSDGNQTISVLTATLKLAKRVTGNDGGSLGLYPAIYFYGPTGRHSGAMFMGTMALIGMKLLNNDKMAFQKVTLVRSKLERILVTHKDLIATILQKQISRKRVEKYKNLLDELIDRLVKKKRKCV